MSEAHEITTFLSSLHANFNDLGINFSEIPKKIPIPWAGTPQHLPYEVKHERGRTPEEFEQFLRTASKVDHDFDHIRVIIDVPPGTNNGKRAVITYMIAKK